MVFRHHLKTKWQPSGFGLLLGTFLAFLMGACSFSDSVPREVLEKACRIEFGEDLPKEVTQTSTMAIPPDLNMAGFSTMANVSWNRGSGTVKKEYLRLKSGQWVVRVESLPLVFLSDGKLDARAIGCEGVFERPAGAAAEGGNPSETAAVKIEMKATDSACSGTYEIGGGEIDRGEITLFYTFDSPSPGLRKYASQELLLLRSTKTPTGLKGAEKGDVSLSGDILHLAKKLFFDGTDFPGGAQMDLARVK